jgi:ATP synthase F1 complex assembly factor 1
MKGLGRGFSFTYPCPRKLREVIKMSLFEKESPATIKTIWNEYHLSRPTNVSNVITSGQYLTLNKRLKESPFFLFPLKRESGYFFMISQSQEKSNLFTFLENFKKNPGNAAPYFVLTLFDELVLIKGLVLIRGDVIDHQVTKKEADLLLKSFIAYYIETGLYEEVQKFNHQPGLFNHESHVSNFFSRFS